MNLRLFRLLLLLATLLAGQWGGFLHAAGHHQDGDEPHAACELCGAYGTLDQGFATAPAATFATSPAIAAPAPVPAGRPLSVHTHFRSRAPPALA